MLRLETVLYWPGNWFSPPLLPLLRPTLTGTVRTAAGQL